MADQYQFPVDERATETRFWAFVLFPLLLFALSSGTRMVAIGRYITPDEPTWVYRSIEFREAIRQADWSGTLVAGHPGVTTAWLGAIGMSAQMIVFPESRADYDWLTHIAYLAPDNVEAFRRLAVLLTGGRFAVVAVNSLGIAVIYLLLKRLWGWQAAVAGGLLLAFDPFLAGLSGLLHVDGLSATFATLSLLATAVGLRKFGAGEYGWRAMGWPAIAGVMGGLAVLTKSPMLLLIPFTGLAVLWLLVADRRVPARRRWVWAISFAFAWGISFLATVIILFPAIWAAPTVVWQTISGSANRHLDEALRQTFFLREVAFVHGPLFYPVALLWRLSPVVWLGLLLAAAYAIKGGRGFFRANRTKSPLLLALWAILFIVAITPAAKKFDRYILPAVPSLLILAALGWAALDLSRSRLFRWVLSLAVIAQVGYWFLFAGYPLSAYNLLVGGPWTAVRVLPIGWGESISASGEYLSQTQADVEARRAISGIAPSLAPFFSGETLVYGFDDPAAANYVVVTQGGRQLDPAEFEAQTRGLTLIHTERFGGLEQAWVYERLSPAVAENAVALAAPANFDNRIALIAYGQSVVGETVEIDAEWRRLTALEDDERFILRIVISDEAGNIWASHETDLLNEVYFFPPDWTEDDSGIVRYLLELPPGIPPSTYSVSFTLIDNRTAGQLPVRVGDGAFQGVIYEAGDIHIVPPESIISTSRMQIPNAAGTTWFDGDLQLLGFGDIPAEALAGSRLPVELFWHAPQSALPNDIMLSWQLMDADGSGRVLATMPLSRFDTGMWRLGESIHEKYLVSLPPDLPPGRYELVVCAHNGGETEYIAASLGLLKLNNIDRLYSLPEDMPVPLNVEWDPLVLSGMGPAELSGSPGETIDLTLYWEKRARYGDVYSVFVHIVDEDGNIVLQSDHWPGGLPTDILDEGQIVVDRLQLRLPDELPPGRYDVRVGLYSAADGQRLPVGGGDGVASHEAPDYVILPLPLIVESR